MRFEKRELAKSLKTTLWNVDLPKWDSMVDEGPSSDLSPKSTTYFIEYLGLVASLISFSLADNYHRFLRERRYAQSLALVKNSYSCLQLALSFLSTVCVIWFSTCCFRYYPRYYWCCFHNSFLTTSAWATIQLPRTCISLPEGFLWSLMSALPEVQSSPQISSKYFLPCD